MRYLALFIISCVALPSYALTQVDIYRSEVVINDEDKTPEATARKQGMEQVLIRATGNTQVVKNETVQKALGKSAQYLSQLSYGGSNEQATLKMAFNAAQIRSLLTQAQLPYWPDTRANILVWLVEDKNYDRTIAWEHSDSMLRVGLLDNATRRGLPLTLPVGDFDDITGIEVSDLWGSFVGPISASSKRYPVDAILVIRAQRQGLRWTLYDQKPSLLVDSPKAPITGAASGNTQVQAKRLIDEVSNYYANKSAVTVAGESSVSQLVNIVNVQDAQDFFELENGLKALNSVASLDILNIQNNQVTFKVHLLSSPEEFTAELRRIRQLSEVEVIDVVEEVAPELEQQVNSVSVDAVKIDSHTEASVTPVTIVKQDSVTTPGQLLSTTDEPTATLSDEPSQKNTESEAVDDEVQMDTPKQTALKYQWTKA